MLQDFGNHPALTLDGVTERPMVYTADGKEIVAFVRKLRDYQKRIAAAKWEERPLCGNVGLMRGLVVHFAHGTRKNRRYGSRGKILLKHGFDPDNDLKPDWQGLYQLTDRAPGLRRDIQKYFEDLDDS